MNMKKRIYLILAVALVAALLGLYGCHKAETEETEPTITTEVTEATTEATEAAEATEQETKAVELDDAETAVTEGGKPQTDGLSGTGSVTTGSSDVQQTGSGGSGSGSGATSGSSGGGPSGTPATQPPAPTQHVHSYTLSSTTPATCTASGSSTYTCSCGDSYTDTIPQTTHSWVHHHQDEVKHQEFKCVCQCGAQFGSESEWAAHAKSYDAVEAITNHGHWGSVPFWIIDTPAKDWDECSICGATK